MPKIRYRRSGRDDPEEIEAFGQVFEAGEWVPVADKFLDKARGNPSFEVEGETTYGDREGDGEREEGPDVQERRSRARVAQAGAEETKKARQAEARGGSHKDERA